MNELSIMVVIESTTGNEYESCEAYELTDTEKRTELTAYADRPDEVKPFTRTYHLWVRKDMSVRCLSDQISYRGDATKATELFGQRLIEDLDITFHAFDVARAAAFPDEYRKWVTERMAERELSENDATPVEIVKPVLGGEG